MKTICIFGTGSLGANTAINIARILGDTVNFVLVDYDRIEEVNLANQPWYDVNIGQHKATVLASYLYRTAKCTSIAITKKVTQGAAFISQQNKCINDIDVFVDCFDNMTARKLTRTIGRKTQRDVLHAGFAENVYLCKWNNNFPLTNEINRAPVCDRRDLSTLVTLGAGITAHHVAKYLHNGAKIETLLELYNDNIVLSKV